LMNTSHIDHTSPVLVSEPSLYHPVTHRRFWKDSVWRGS
jgi:hypothetical protein